MNRRELVRAVAAHTDLEPRQVDQVVRGITDVVTGVVSKGETVTLSGFAKFAKVERGARMGRNPATGEQIRIKASKKARITPLKGFKEAVMTPSKAPKLAKGVWPLAEDGGTAAKKASTKKAGATKAAGTSAKKASTKKASATKATAKRATAKKATAKKATAKKASARR